MLKKLYQVHFELADDIESEHYVLCVRGHFYYRMYDIESDTRE